jgi:DNA-binding transcriptional MerR regulator
MDDNNVIKPSRLDPTSSEPLYNIGIVSRMTGIPVATLRVWQRRYQFPTSIRTPGKHRLFSEREVIRLRWVKARVDEGMQIGQAVRALLHLEQQGRFPEVLSTTTRAQQSLPDPSLTNFRIRLTELLLTHDLQQADSMLGEILSLYSLEELILEVVSPSLNQIGEAWLNREIDIASEHLATHFLRQRLLMWMLTGPVPFNGVQPVLLACAPEELHEGSLLIMGVLLRRKGWPVAYLGQNVPLMDLGALVRRMNPSAVVLVAMIESGARALMEWPLHMPEAAETGSPLVGYGGLIFNHHPEWRTQVRGLFLGETIREGVDRLDRELHRIFRPLG